MARCANVSAPLLNTAHCPPGSQALPAHPQVVEVIQGRFLFAFVRDVTLFAASPGVQEAVCYSIDSELVRTTQGNLCHQFLPWFVSHRATHWPRSYTSRSTPILARSTWGTPSSTAGERRNCCR